MSRRVFATVVAGLLSGTSLLAQNVDEPVRCPKSKTPAIRIVAYRGVADATPKSPPPDKLLKDPMPSTSTVDLAGSPCLPCEPKCVNPRFWVRGEYLFWRMKGVTPTALVTTGPASSFGELGGQGTVVLVPQGGLLNDGMSGGRVSAGVVLDECRGLALDASYFILDRNQTGAFFGPDAFPVITRPFFSLNEGAERSEAINFPGLVSGGLTFSATSAFSGGDVNLRKLAWCSCWGRVDLVAGFRYANLRDGLSVLEAGQADPSLEVVGGATNFINDRFATDNKFYGFQVGSVAEFRWKRLFAELTGKVAFGASHQEVNINGSQLLTLPGGAPTPFAGGLLALGSNSGRRDRDEFAWLPELGINVGFCLGDHCRVFAGYNFLYWSNVLRAADQIDRVLDVNQIPNFGTGAAVSTTRPIVPFRDTDFWAKGLTGGVQLRW